MEYQNRLALLAWSCDVQYMIRGNTPKHSNCDVTKIRLQRSPFQPAREESREGNTPFAGRFCVENGTVGKGTASKKQSVDLRKL